MLLRVARWLQLLYLCSNKILCEVYQDFKVTALARKWPVCSALYMKLVEIMKKRKPVQPDEVFDMGPLQFSRLGSTIVAESHWTKEGHAEMIRRAAADFPNVVRKVDGLVGNIVELVRYLPPDQLLLRAWWSVASVAINTEAEADFGSDGVLYVRMIDYIQSVIASVKPVAVPRGEITDKEWKHLCGLVEKLFSTIAVEYNISNSARKMLAEDEVYDSFFDEFYVRAQLYWCNVRGERYQFHMVPYFEDMFLPHTKIFQDLFSITSEEFVEGLMRLCHQLTFGINDVINDIASFGQDALGAVEIAAEEGLVVEGMSPAEVMATVVAEKGWEERQQNVLERMCGLELFDVAGVTGWPEDLVSELTWKPGEDADFFSGDEFRGWPLRIWPVFKRPFIELNGLSCCFDIHSLSDNIYRVMQRVCTRLKPSCKNDWNRVQKAQSEELPVRYFEQILPGATVYRSVYYRWFPNASAPKKNWCEADALIVYDDCLFIVEVKAGAFTYTSPADDFPAFISSLKNLVQKPAIQGKRFLNYLEDADAVSLFDEDHNEIGQMCRDDFRRIVICPVSVDPFTEMAAKVQHLRKIGVDIGTYPVWAISLDDLRVYSDVFDDPLMFIHYVEQRMRAFSSDVIEVDDELDHLGLYLKHNNYVMYAEEIKGETHARMNFNGYRSEVDRFFLLRGQDHDVPSSLAQEMPERILEIVRFLSSSCKPNRTELSSFFLDLSSATRGQVAEHIERDLNAQQGSLRPKMLSAHGGINFTLCCYREPFVSRQLDVALDHAQTVMLVQNDERRLLVELVYNCEGRITEVYWQWLTLDGLSDVDRKRLQGAVKGLKERRKAKAVAKNGKIGRNDPCPCGSGKKYKKCCLK